MSVDACAGLVRRGDPDRFLSAMTAPQDLRGRLMVLYAFNLEIARIPWISREPMIAEMRLQFWRDIAADIASEGTVPSHEIAGPLVELVCGLNLPCEMLQTMIDARRFDIHPDPFKTPAALETYIDRTAGHLMWLSALALGAPQEAEQPIRNYAHGTGMAALLRALPQLRQYGRVPLTDTSDAAIADLAERALQRIGKAQKAGRQIPAAAAPALRAGWRARALLRRAKSAPSRVLTDGLEEAEFRRKSHLIWITMRKKW